MPLKSRPIATYLRRVSEATNRSWLDRQVLLLVAATLTLLGGWYFATVIAPPGLGEAAPAAERGLLPEWVGCREILLRHNPYRPEVQREIEARASSGARSFAAKDEHRYAYPVFFVFLFLPLAVLPFSIAQWLALVTGAVLTGVSVRCWLRDSEPGKRRLALVIMLLFASYPTILDLQLRQPTMLIAALLAASFASARSGRLVLAGIFAALSAAKPQLAAPVLLPMLVWGLAEWRSRKAFLFSMCATVAALLIAAEALVPGWFYGWIGTVAAYRHYAGAKPPLMEILPPETYFVAVATLAGVIVWVSMRFHRSDMLLAISFSIAAFQLLEPVQLYNQLALLVPTLWIAQKGEIIRSCGQVAWLCRGLVWTVLGMGWGSQIALTIADLVAPGSAQTLWQLPLVAAWLYPWPVFLTLVVPAFAFSSPVPQDDRSGAQFASLSADA